MSVLPIAEATDDGKAESKMRRQIETTAQRRCFPWICAELVERGNRETSKAVIGVANRTASIECRLGFAALCERVDIRKKRV